MQNKESKNVLLRNCPFCGGEVEVEQFIDSHKRVKFGIECKNYDCDVNTFTDWYADKHEAIEAWNRRDGAE